MLSSSVRTSSRHLRTVEHANKSAANAGFDFGTIPSYFHLTIGVPRVAQSSCSVERESVGREPLDLEWFTKRLWCSRAWTCGVVVFS